MAKGTRARRQPTESVRRALELNCIQSEAHLYRRGSFSERLSFLVADELSRVFESKCMVESEAENSDRDGIEGEIEEEVVPKSRWIRLFRKV